MSAPKGHIGYTIRELRRERGLSQEGLARAVDVSTNTIRNVERGDVQPRLDTCRRLAQVLGVSLTTLVEGAA